MFSTSSSSSGSNNSSKSSLPTNKPHQHHNTYTNKNDTNNNMNNSENDGGSSGSNSSSQHSLALHHQQQQQQQQHLQHHHLQYHHSLLGHNVKPPASVVNSSPYDHQLLERLLPRHITTEHVVFSHKTKVGGRSLYFFSPAARGGLTKPVFTTREKLAQLLDGPGDDEDDGEDVYSGGGHGGRRSSSVPGSLSSPPWSGRRGRSGGRDELSPGVVCTIKRVHLVDPACDLGVSVWRGRGPQRGLQGPQRPPCGIGPALLVESPDSGRGGGDGMAVAAGFSGEVMYLLPYSILGRTDLEPRATEILVQDAMLSCVSESVVWFVVKSFTRKKVISNPRQLSNQKLNITKLNLRSSHDHKKSS